MKKASEYRVHALECRSLASQANSDDHRKQLLAMAETWETLADDRDRNSKVLASVLRPETAS
jgi:hypothetical protein